MNERRFVLDTNLIVSAALKKDSLPRKAVDWANDNGIILQSLVTIAELNEVMRRAKFNKYVPEEVRLDFLATLQREAEIIEITTTITECRDPKDNKFLELAVSGDATCIISGDDDLLTLHPFRNIPVLNPRQYLDSSKLPFNTPDED